jgi:glycosyltransferase involved in cell wall biosynthesis
VTAPLVSVIVPVRNGARFLREALDSAVLNGYAPIDVVVLDGRSTDGSAEIARSYPGVRVIVQAGHGLSDAWNTGLDAARGELIAFLDSDDVWFPGKLADQVAYLRDHPEALGVLGHAVFFAEPGVTVRGRFGRSDLEQPRLAYLPSALLARRGLFDLVGGFDTRLVAGGDVDWFARVKDAGVRLAALPRLVVRKRVHDRNLSVADVSESHRDILEALRRSVRRQQSRDRGAKPGGEGSRPAT